MSFILKRMLKQFGVVPTHKVTIRKNARVRMPDGAELMADLYLGTPNARAPVILIRSPYGRSVFLAAGGAYPLASQGFNVVMQSCRGTFGSSGTFDPHHDEHRDGLATIEWIKQQPWYGGSMATYGMSYLGYVQWAIAAAAGPEVKAMAIQVAPSDFSQMTYAGNSFALENALSWTNMVTMMKKPFPMLRMILSRLRGGAIRRGQWNALPLANMDAKIVGERVHFWQDWIEHSSFEDPWWKPMSFRESIKNIKRPITTVAGWFDIFLPYQMHDFIEMQKAGIESRITIGAWGHTDAGLGRTGIHDAIDWFNRILRGSPGESWPKPVKLYVIGANEWRYFDQWPPRESIPEHWYLQPERNLADRAAPESAADQYRYDPTDPTPSIGGPTLEASPFSVDNTTLEARGDVLTYTSEAFREARDIIGTIVADLYVSSSAASADFFVRVCDVDANGLSKNVCDGLQRVTIAAQNTPQRIRVELWPTGYRIAAGHRLRVQVSSGAFPRWSRNLGGTEPMGHATELRVATQSIHHSPECPSAVIVPFISTLSP